MTPILESDWKRFKELHRELLERHCRQTLEQLVEIARTSKDDSHDAYLKVWRLIQDRNREMADLFNDFRRSTAISQLMIMQRRGLLVDSNLNGFSEELRSRLHSVKTL